MSLLTKKVADRVAGIDEPGTTTGDIDDINHYKTELGRETQNLVRSIRTLS